MTIYCAGNMLVDIFHIGYILLLPALKYADYWVINELESPSLAKLTAEADRIKHESVQAVI